MANWSALRDALSNVSDRRTFDWEDLDELVGGLPRSAYEHSAFWSGQRSGWPGFRTTDVDVGRSVTFVRRTAEPTQDAEVHERARPSMLAPHEAPPSDVVLIGCVKSKLSRAAPARDLYTSALFTKGRAYAERSGVPWFILSAEHGLLAPDEIVEPYELRLSRTRNAYRRAWGERVLQQLEATIGSLPSKIIEIHAGAAYANAIRPGLLARGATIVEPLQGLRMGERLRWYGDEPAPAVPQAAQADIDDAVRRLQDATSASSTGEFLATNGRGTRSPGLYSWWVDDSGADDLSAGLAHSVEPGLIYAGLAGAARSRSRRKSTNTLWGRIRGMHLGGRHEFSTFRLSLGSILAAAWGDTAIDEERLTTWMHDHLQLIAIPVADADGLDRLETEVLAALDPPLNLSKMAKTPVRTRLSGLRRQYSTRSKRNARRTPSAEHSTT